MKKLALILCVLMYLPVYPQISKVKSLFDIVGDLRNPSFFIPLSYNISNSLIFEVHKDSTSNIYVSDYSADKDSFLTPYPITTGNNLNINPVGIWTWNEKIIFFQTNVKGNWDIAYRENKNGVWSDIKIITDSVSDDRYPSFLYNYNNFNLGIAIVYQKNNSIYMFIKNDTSEINEAILKENDSTKYSFPVGYCYRSFWTNGWVTTSNFSSVMTVNNKNKTLINYIKILNYNSDTTVIIDRDSISNLNYSNIHGQGFTFDKTENGKTSVYYFDQFSSNSEQLSINDTLNGDFSNLKLESYIRPIIDKKLLGSYSISIYPYIYNYSKNDSAFIGLSGGYSSFKDTLINVKSVNLKSDVEFMTYYNAKEVNYAVWEDSINSSIKLFGLKILTPYYNDVKKENKLSFYSLYQNYPNPFNPSTKIKYQIPKSGLVTLKVYDILGREVATLVNKEKPSGNYEVTFDGSGLASGVYYYQLKAGDFISSKKMIILK